MADAEDDQVAVAVAAPKKGKLLRIACAAGIALLAAGIACFVLLGGDLAALMRRPLSEEAFLKELKELDESGKELELLSRHFDKLEKQAPPSVELYLSLLKRRRFLARQNARFITAYQETARKAVTQFPDFEPCAAIMAESLLLEQDAATTHNVELRMVLGRLTQERFKALALSSYALLGSLYDPVEAVQIANKNFLFAPPTADAEAYTALTINSFILRILDGDYNSVITALNEMPDLDPVEAPVMARFAAEVYYDYGDSLRAAEIFSRFPADAATTGISYLAREADALWVAGYVSAARLRWTTLGNSTQEKDSASKARSLYNLAASADDKAQEATFLKRQLALNDETYRELGVIRYSRLFPAVEALEILTAKPPQAAAPLGENAIDTAESTKTPFGSASLLALETVRRRMETESLRRAVAETWLLLNEYPDDTRLYEWACYFFNYQRRYDETALLVKNANKHNIKGIWLDMHEALRMAREGGLSEGLDLLVNLPEYKYWQIPANIARIQEARRSPTAALGYYERAASLVGDNIEGARIQFRIALCLRALDREAESRAALQHALELDPDNLSARLELRRPLAEN
ncbi:MAG: hypothetical protein LBS86_02260 [Treponema sp.]|jgi:tetratricopeptide (TPR) repeat protein|nr:hypothetical protein [Treponema sp.]